MILQIKHLMKSEAFGAPTYIWYTGVTTCIGGGIIPQLVFQMTTGCCKKKGKSRLSIRCGIITMLIPDIDLAVSPTKSVSRI
jgi:hypothetical protein